VPGGVLDLFRGAHPAQCRNRAVSRPAVQIHILNPQVGTRLFPPFPKIMDTEFFARFYARDAFGCLNWNKEKAPFQEIFFCPRKISANASINTPLTVLSVSSACILTLSTSRRGIFSSTPGCGRSSLFRFHLWPCIQVPIQSPGKNGQNFPSVLRDGRGIYRIH
jgi:hypothetical protein